MGEAETIQFFKDHLISTILPPVGQSYKIHFGNATDFNRLKDEDVSPNNTEIGQINKQTIHIKNLQTRTEIRRVKIKESVVDYSDLIANTLKLFRSRKKILRIPETVANISLMNFRIPTSRKTSS